MGFRTQTAVRSVHEEGAKVQQRKDGSTNDDAEDASLCVSGLRFRASGLELGALVCVKRKGLGV